MQKLVTIFLILCSMSCFSQSEYEIFESYNTEGLRKQNSQIKRVTGFQIFKNGIEKIISYKEFSEFGLPTKIVEYDENSNQSKATEFVYTTFRLPSVINTFQKGTKFTTSEFHYDSSKNLAYFKDYVYSSFDGKKMLLWKTTFEYYINKKLKAMTKMEVSDILPKQDTVEVTHFDSFGVKTDAYFDMAGYKQYFTYEWNQDKTEMTEIDHSGDSIQSTTIHKYKGEYEIERIEKDSEKPLVFWKYDKENHLIQTNSSIIVTQDLFYDYKGYLVKESWTANFPELIKDEDSKIMRFVYKYQFK